LYTNISQSRLVVVTGAAVVAVDAADVVEAVEALPVPTVTVIAGPALRKTYPKFLPCHI
jgi:hypothetical protein